MLKTSHIKVADSTIKNIENNIGLKVNRAAYLAGSVLPDLNCAFPLHTIDMTFKRFRKKLNRMDNAESIIIKSFTLGVITHYICDYFCYAHNIAFPNPKHAIYERHMRKHLETDILHSIISGDKNKELEIHWKNIKKHIIDEMIHSNEEFNTMEIINSITTKGIIHINYILELINYMHIDYIEKTNSTDTEKWCSSIPKIELDIEYAMFMCSKIALLILNPVVEMGVRV